LLQLAESSHSVAVPLRSALADLRRYALASAVSCCLVLGLSAALHELVGLAETVAVALALVLAFAVNFTLLRRWVFPGQVASVGRQAAETAIASIGFRGLEYAVFLGLHLGLDIDYLIATAASLCLSAGGKFAVYRQLVFNRDRGSARSEAGAEPLSPSRPEARGETARPRP
jgi:putative flippase GtrA